MLFLDAQPDGGHRAPKYAMECVTTHRAKQLALKIDGALASSPYRATVEERLWRKPYPAVSMRPRRRALKVPGWFIRDCKNHPWKWSTVYFPGWFIGTSSESKHGLLGRHQKANVVCRNVIRKQSISEKFTFQKFAKFVKRNRQTPWFTNFRFF